MPNLFKQDSPDPASGNSSADRASPDRSEARRGRSDRPASVSVVGSGMEIDGEITAHGDLQIEGRVKGDLSVEGQVSIKEGGFVQGEIRADRVMVAGTVEGSIVASERTRLVDGARVQADVESPRLELEDGALLDGRVDMGIRSKGGRPAISASDGGQKDSSARDRSGSAAKDGSEKGETDGDAAKDKQAKGVA